MKSQQHRIPPLEGGFKDLDSKIEPLKEWRKAEEASQQEGVKQVKYPVNRNQGLITIGIGVTWCVLISILLYHLLVYLGSLAINSILFSSIIAGVTALIVVNLWIDRRVDRAKRKLLTERKAAPMYQRCQLILRAVESYKVHCERYETWQQAANLDLLDRDNELAVRYQNFIMQAHENLERAISDFLRNVELARVQKEFLEKHQLSIGPDDVALSQLMAQVNQPMEIPDATRVLEPRIRLECEQELQEIFDDPLNEHELASRMDALPRR